MMTISHKTVDRIRRRLDESFSEARSKWSRAVLTYARGFCDDLEEMTRGGKTLELADGFRPLNEELLNGADDWVHYSQSGCALCYDDDIAERLFPRSRAYTRTGRLRLSSGSLLGYQAEALCLASHAVHRAARWATEHEEE